MGRTVVIGSYVCSDCKSYCANPIALGRVTEHCCLQSAQMCSLTSMQGCIYTFAHVKAQTSPFCQICTHSSQSSRSASSFLPVPLCGSINPFTHVSHYWWKQSFRVFGMGCDRPSAKLQTAKNVLLYPSRHTLSQHSCLHPSEWVPRGHRGGQNCQHSKRG